MVGLPKSSHADEGLASSYPKPSGAFLSSLFKSKSRDSDSDSLLSTSDVTPASSAPGALPGNANGSRSQQQHTKPVKGNDKAESSASSGSNWLLGRRTSEKKKEKPERFKHALFGHNSHATSASKEVKGAVKVSDDRAAVLYAYRPDITMLHATG